MFIIYAKAEWKVRLLLHPGAEVEVQALPAPADAGTPRVPPFSRAEV
jgi:hypothetical protein